MLFSRMTAYLLYKVRPVLVVINFVLDSKVHNLLTVKNLQDSKENTKFTHALVTNALLAGPCNAVFKANIVPESRAKEREIMKKH